MADHAALGALPENHWIHKALAKTKKGGLHKSMGVPQGDTIPAGKMQAATHSANPLERKQAQMAENMHG